jgi:hypothetical protein
MDATLKNIEAVDDDVSQDRPFGNYEEEAIVSLAIDHPEFFTAVGRFMTPDMFGRLECQFVMGKLLNHFENHSILPTRELLRDEITTELTEDDPFEPILEIVDRKSQPREVPIVKDTLLKWARDRAFGLLYSDEAQDAYARGDYGYLETILQDANRIADVGTTGFWFFENFQMLFEPSMIQHRTTGFARLDAVLNNGGPSPKEVLCWMAPTNVGKSVMLCNNAISSLKGTGPDGMPGQDVLLITFELDAIKTAMRCLGVAAEHVKLNDIANRQQYVSRIITQMQRTYKKRFLIVELAPDECSVNHIYALLDNLRRTENWHPDVIVLDYLDLMISRVAAHNKDDYTMQKHVANEVRGLAKNEEVLIFTATQTNRSASSGEEVADLSKAAESYAKQFSLDYIITLNQTVSERKCTPPRMRMFVAKNRNGPKHETITASVDYDTMLIREES